MQREQSSAQECPSSRRNPLPLLAPAVPWCPRWGRAWVSSEQPGGGGLAKREMEDSCLPASRVLSSASPSQAGRRCLEGSGRGGVPGKGGQEENCIQSSAVPPAEKQTWRQMVPLSSNKPKIPFCFPITAAILRGCSWTLLSLKAADPCQGLQPGRTSQPKLTSVLSRRKLLHGGISVGAGNVSEVWLSSFLGLRSRIKLYLLLL